MNRPWWRAAGLYVGGGVLGLAAFFPASWASGFRLAEGVGVDSRQVHWLLEWYWTCASGAPICGRLSDAPIFYPAAGALQFGDPTPGLGGLYSLLRSCGIGADAAFRTLVVALAAAAYAAALVWLRRGLRFAPWASVAGAWLFAFGSPRAAQIDHPHLFATFPLPLLLAVLGVALRESSARRRRALWFAAAGIYVLQASLNLTIAWLSAVFLALVLLAALAFPATRSRVAALARLDTLSLAGAVAAGAAFLVPLLRWMLAGHAQVGGAGQMTQVFDFLPQPESWVFLGPRNFVWGWLYELRPIRTLPYAWEHELGVGMITLGIIAAGAWTLRRRPWSAPVFAASAAFVLLATRWPGGASLWALVHEVVPGAAAVRAVGRVSLVLLAPAAAALAAGASAVAQRGRRREALAAVLVFAAIVVEQARSPVVHEPARARARERAVAAAVPADCPVFFYSEVADPPRSPWVIHVDAMWAALALGRPTINGSSSYAPAGWGGLNECSIPDWEGRDVLRKHLGFWAALTGLEPGSACWITVGAEGANPSLVVESVDSTANPFTNWAPKPFATVSPRIPQ